MRAKVIETNEIVEVEFLMKTSDRTFVYREIPTLPTSRMFQQTDLMFFDVNPTKEIDWEQRRYELVKSALNGMLANSRYVETAYNKAEKEKVEVEFIVAFNAARYADAVIEKLKEE